VVHRFQTRTHPAAFYEHNTTDEFTVKYELTNFEYVVTVNNVLGSFRLGVSFAPSGSIYVPDAPPDSRAAPVVVISLLSAKYREFGFLGFKVQSLIADSGLQKINFASTFNPFLVNLWVTGGFVNATAKQEVDETLGTVYNLNPQITNSTLTLISNYEPGQYYLSAVLNLYRITPWHNSHIGELNITEPWLDVLN